MAKRWTLDEDDFLFHFYCSATERVIALNDLERSAAAIRARVKFLKDSGAWAVLEEWEEASEAYQDKYNTCLKNGTKPAREAKPN